jgi:hypothetical protein
MDWYSSNAFTLGESYTDADGAHRLQFAGALTARLSRRLPGVSDQPVEVDDESERVLVFSVDDPVGPTSFYVHTKADADLGYSFISLRAGFRRARRRCDRSAPRRHLA